jgi:hypothetical protein
VSNSLAVAAVTSTLRYLLDRALQAEGVGPVGGAKVTTLRPERLTDPDFVTAPGINVYLYDVHPNPAWNPTDLPTRRREDGSLARRPVVALDLHYLLTCYGEDESLDAQRLLGRAALALTVTPVLTRDLVVAAVETLGEGDTDFLAESDLADQVDRVKVAPHSLTLEEKSKLWGIFGVPHMLSQTYVATAAVLEADATPRQALPVQRPSVAVNATAPPRLDALRTDPPGGAVGSGSVLVLVGAGLSAPPGASVVVRIGPVLLEPSSVEGAAVTVTVDDVVPAGLHGVRVLHRAAAPGGPDRILGSSNVLPALVRPTVSVASMSPDVVLALSPALRAGQRATIELRRLAPGPAGSPDHVLLRMDPVPAADAPQAQITLPAGTVPSGQWLLGTEVDGVASVPQLVGDVYGAPSLSVP